MLSLRERPLPFFLVSGFGAGVLLLGGGGEGEERVGMFAMAVFGWLLWLAVMVRVVGYGLGGEV